jgi:hypothetical protein
MCCPRCNGYLVRDLGFQTTTHNGTAYHCVNCGNYIDLHILRNKQLTLAEREANADKRTKHSVGDDSASLSGFSAKFLDGSSLFDLM